ncbi:probable protein phosphatase 2C 59 [Musa acuminata AAA Group]|uniref:probable protein phosphatase 2C 59 n=1 Tax=Musa acuminata AAA Group TaxID=214697 RepID=UPI0031D4AF3D
MASVANKSFSEANSCGSCSQNREAGSTASTAVLVGDRLLVANVGDSRAVICRGGDGTWRVGGVLAVSRAFGDRHLKQFVVADPEIHEEAVDGSLEFLILASDGLWDVVTNEEEVVAIVKPLQDPEQAAKKLLQEAYQRGSSDNIACVVVQFLG